MNLQFKNKIQMAFGSMCTEGAKKGGIPKQINVSVEEAMELIAEIKYLRAQQDNVTTLKLEPLNRQQDLNDLKHPIYLIRMVWDTETPDLHVNTINAFLDFWLNGEILVTYSRDEFKVPVLVDKPKNYKNPADKSEWNS